MEDKKRLNTLKIKSLTFGITSASVDILNLMA